MSAIIAEPMPSLQSRLKDLFEYRDGCLFWIEDKGNAKKGARAGYQMRNRYRQIGIDGQLFLEHRLIFILHFGWAPRYLDHIDGNRENNKIQNLRPATNSENMCNRGPNSNNKSGFKGVWFRKDRRKWTAQIEVRGKKISLGVFCTAKDAHDAYCKAADKFHGEFANYGPHELAG